MSLRRNGNYNIVIVFFIIYLVIYLLSGCGWCVCPESGDLRVELCLDVRVDETVDDSHEKNADDYADDDRNGLIDIELTVFVCECVLCLAVELHGLLVDCGLCICENVLDVFHSSKYLSIFDLFCFFEI